MSSKASDFQFELNETLYFNYGDEVLELIGISLNPDISIHPNETEVLMRGEIELRGEYIRDEASRVDDMDEIETKRFVTEVESKEERIAVFTHHFPVDITVPASRVENIDEIRIEIVTFDYELPMNSKLQFAATAEIQGIKAEKWSEEEVEAEEKEEKIERIEEGEEEEQEPEIKDEFPPFEFEVERPETDFENKEEKHEQKTVEEELEVVDDREESEALELIEDDEEPKENELTIRAKEEEEETSEEEKEEQVNDVGYLTDIFREDEEESYAKMKICIVQDEDTIESIAERFEISALQLIKQNKLDDDFDISEGQLLYIPQK